MSTKTTEASAKPVERTAPRIAIDARSISSSTGTYVRNLIRYLQDIDQTSEYTIFVRTGDAHLVADLAPNYFVQEVAAGAYSLAEQTVFARVLLRGRFDLVHFAMQQQPVFYPRARVTTFHDLTIIKHNTLARGRFVNAVFRLCARLSFLATLHANRRIIAPSEYTRSDLVRFSRIPAWKAIVTYEAADDPQPDENEYVLPFSEYLLYVGNFYEYKNVRRLIEAHRRIRQSGRDVGLVLVGNLHKAGLDLKKKAESDGIEGLVFTGFIPDSQRNWLYRHCAAYVFPSVSEGFGLPGLEAMSNGAPVIAANATCLPEIYGDAAHYFDPRDPTDMADVIQRVLNSSHVRAALVEAGRARVADYSWKRMSEQTHDVYMGAIAASVKAAT